MTAANKNRVLYNFLLWTLLYAFWILIFQNRELTLSRTLGIEFCYLVFIAVNYYFNIYYTIPTFLNRQRYVQFALISLFFFIITSWIRAEVVLIINGYFYHIPADQINFSTLYGNSLLNIFIWTEVLIVLKMVLDRIKFQRYAEAVEKEKVLNELNFLRAQNNPHFLFNSLNAIYFQIDKNNKDARETLMRLSEMLRYQLYECGEEQILVDHEIAFLRNYIELQKLRLNENYEIIFMVDSDVSNFKIAPLLIMPLLENAFKYVSHFSEKSNKITIHLSTTNDLFQCTINNTIEKMPQTPAPSAGGIGLKNLQRRLALLYPNKHEIVFATSESQYEVKLTLETNEN